MSDVSITSMLYNGCPCCHYRWVTFRWFTRVRSDHRHIIGKNLAIFALQRCWCDWNVDINFRIQPLFGLSLIASELTNEQGHDENCPCCVQSSFEPFVLIWGSCDELRCGIGDAQQSSRAIRARRVSRLSSIWRCIWWCTAAKSRSSVTHVTVRSTARTSSSDICSSTTPSNATSVRWEVAPVLLLLLQITHNYIATTTSFSPAMHCIIMMFV